MNRLANILVLAGTCVSARNVSAQASTPAQNPIGVWRGRSQCRVHPSPCHDEITVYRITRVNAGDTLSMDAGKIVNGQEEEMGVMACLAGASGAQLTCKIPNGVWRFTIRGDSLVGELRLPDNRKFRDVSAVRSH